MSSSSSSTTTTTTTSSVSQGLKAILGEPRCRQLQLVLPSKSGEEESVKCWDLVTNLGSSSWEKVVYVQPQRSLSTKGLEMCTESLGSESGILIDSEKQSSKEKVMTKKKKKNKVTSFPPPLTSGVQLETHRHGGRLLIKTSFTCTSYFQAERKDGRLRLSLLKSTGDSHQQQLDQDINAFWGHEDEEEEEQDIIKEQVWSTSTSTSTSTSSSRCNCNDDTSNSLINATYPYWVAIS